MRILKKLDVIFTRRQKRSFILLFVMILFGGLLEMVGISMLMPVIMVMIDPQSLRNALASLTESFPFVRNAVDRMGLSSDAKLITFLCVVLIAIYVLKAVFQLFIVYRQNRFIHRTRNLVRKDTLQSAMSMPYESYLNMDIPLFHRLMQNDIPNAFTLLLSLLQLFSEIVVAVFLSAFLLYINTGMTLIMLLLLLAFTLFNTKILKPRLNRLGNTDRKYGALSFKWLSQGINGLKDIRVLHRENYIIDQYYASGKEEARAQTSYALLNSLPRILIETMFVIAVMAFMMVFVLRGGDSTLLISQMTAFGISAMRLMPGVNRINSYITTISFYEPALNALYEHKLRFPERERTAVSDEVKQEEGKLEFRDEIVLSGVSYRYPGMTEYILHDADMVIRRGASVGIQGTSGAGKSTLVDVLLGLLPMEAGDILCDDVSVFSRHAEWLAHIGYIPQVIYLTDETIRENVGFGLPPEDIHDERVWEVLKQAQLDEFVRGLKDGLDTVVGERGIRLSGGQRQRIGIARALYHDPEILVFDEATSALDNETEAALMEAIESFRGKKTLLIIAHRLNTIQNCDVIYEVGNGKIRKKDSGSTDGEQ
ncbi:MAG: ABC transporter ATP-binding protein [Lachnospiraceae bacterium]|nr:ABC transporter ATP-binding protein [Lachnospiraceae bacterium]